MKNIKWIFFDVSSTLVDETEAYNHRIRDAIKDTDITFEQFNEKRLEFAKRNMKGDIEALKYLGLKKTPWHKEDEILYPETKTILNMLNTDNYNLGIIANQSLGTAERLAKWGILKFIRVVVASAELGIEKPDERIYRYALEIANCLAEESVMIGDRLDNDVFPAKKIGMKTIWIRQGFAIHQQPKDSCFQADYTVNNLAELKDIF